MKRLIMFLFLVMVVTLTSATFATPPVGNPGAAEADPFTYLEKDTWANLTTSSVITPSDIVSTNTHSVAYLADGLKPPYKIRMQVIGANKLYYRTYSVDATTLTVAAPTTTANQYVTDDQAHYLLASATTVMSEPALTNGEVKEWIVLGDPNTVYSGAGSAATVSIQIWRRP